MGQGLADRVRPNGVGQGLTDRGRPDSVGQGLAESNRPDGVGFYKAPWMILKLPRLGSDRVLKGKSCSNIDLLVGALIPRALMAT